MPRHDLLELVGHRVDGKYQVESRVAEGGTSVVYRARHHTLGDTVALKVLTGVAFCPADAQAVMRDLFRQEGELLGRLAPGSPNIVRVRDAGMLKETPLGDVPYIVLEWVEGSSLERILSRARTTEVERRRSPAEVLELLREVTEALAHMHSNGVAHRDLKPANLLVVGGKLAPGAAIKVIDLGAAKQMLAQASAANFHIFTPGYAAPEQMEPLLGRTGPWTDVFSFALIMLEMISGDRIFSPDDPRAFQQRVCEGTPLTPRGLGITVSGALDEVFTRALARRPEDRFRDVSRFWSALRAALAEDEPRPAAPTPTPEMTFAIEIEETGPDTRRRAGVGTLGLIAAIAAALGWQAATLHARARADEVSPVAGRSPAPPLASRIDAERVAGHAP